MPNYKPQFFNRSLQTSKDGNSQQWNAAFGWGNHASASYLTSLPSSGNFQTLTINNVYVFPTGDGSTGQFLKTDGSGNLSFSQSIISDTTNMGGATGINNIVSISQSGYNNLPASSGGPGYNANTVYFIT